MNESKLCRQCNRKAQVNGIYCSLHFVLGLLAEVYYLGWKRLFTGKNEDYDSHKCDKHGEYYTDSEGFRFNYLTDERY